MVAKRDRPKKVVEIKPDVEVPQQVSLIDEKNCKEPGCSNPLAPGQNYVCLTHQRRG